MEKVILELEKLELIRLFELVAQRCAALKCASNFEYNSPAQVVHILFDYDLWCDVCDKLKSKI